MVGLIDIAPLTKTVTIRDVAVEVSGVSARGIAQLLARFPELRALVTGREVAIENLLTLGGDVVAAIIAAGTGIPGDTAAEQAADRLSIDEQADLLVAVIELTMPRGLGPFVEKLSRLGLGPDGASAMPVTRSP
ncbi:hypothetical protein [Hyphomonas sp.]|jgi:hypothetical protein|uniref:phage pre-tape measure protein n=1 Tax=Hyphomonas sp. TaxID=87 RepID=UPI0025BFDC2C|nr:hypothetical protein [Hyphomonas sp.]